MSSDSTVSLHEGQAADVDTWETSSVELGHKLRKVKDWEKVLRAQLVAQSERLDLERQEMENARLESELAHKEAKRRAKSVNKKVMN